MHFPLQQVILACRQVMENTWRRGEESREKGETVEGSLRVAGKKSCSKRGTGLTGEEKRGEGRETRDGAGEGGRESVGGGGKRVRITLHN